jgi:hypothetical protein
MSEQKRGGSSSSFSSSSSAASSSSSSFCPRDEYHSCFYDASGRIRCGLASAHQLRTDAHFRPCSFYQHDGACACLAAKRGQQRRARDD